MPPTAPNGVAGLARQLRDFAVKRHEYSLSVIAEQVEEWQRQEGAGPESYLDIGNQSGKTALHFAAQLRGDGLAELLVSLRADVDVVTTRGHTPLIYACGRGRDSAVKRLLLAGARCRVRTVNGDTAQSMAEGRLLPCTLEALQLAEAAEEGQWLDFTADAQAVAAQADHVVNCPKMAGWTGDIPAPVADLLAERRAQAKARALPSPSHATAVEELAATLTLLLPPVPLTEEEEAQSAALQQESRPTSKVLVPASRPAALQVAVALIRAAASFSDSSQVAQPERPSPQDPLVKSSRKSKFVSRAPKRQATALMRGAILAAARANVDLAPSACTLGLMRAVGVLPEAAQSLEATSELGPKHAKEAKVLATSAALSALRELLPGSTLSVAAIAEEGTPWMAVELLSCPSEHGIDLEVDLPALQHILRGLCHEGAWGSDFGTALRWLAKLRPGPAASDTCAAAFSCLVAIFVQGAVAACGKGRPMRLHLRDDGVLLREARELFGENALDPLLACINESENGGFRLNLPPSNEPKLRELQLQPAAEGAACLELPRGSGVTFVADACGWEALEAQLTSATLVAVDTEWWDTGHGPALVQLAFARGDVGHTSTSNGESEHRDDSSRSISCVACFLLDTLNAPAIMAVGLRRLFQRQDLVVLGWSFGEDRKRLTELCCGAHEGQDSPPEKATQFQVVDVQLLCCELLGLSSKISLSKACAIFLGGPLDKQEQCSDWRTRPLSESQARYAALDAAVLLDLHVEILKRQQQQQQQHQQQQQQ
ncbi:unnamed protein product [Polarella glacialis]|uniref:3'-5' exonuclease domain-containing protein n=1 Tax=Polarella glacialis TaxID=89957 RepID=A0A813GZ73_POLGL|nr:unnamed protein product [Polarella glacialis]